MPAVWSVKLCKIEAASYDQNVDKKVWEVLDLRWSTLYPKQHDHGPL